MIFSPRQPEVRPDLDVGGSGIHGPQWRIPGTKIAKLFSAVTGCAINYGDNFMHGRRCYMRMHLFICTIKVNLHKCSLFGTNGLGR